MSAILLLLIEISLKCGVGVTVIYMIFLYYENRSTGSIKEARGNTDSRESQGPNASLDGKERIEKYTT